jgi:hypothetical protein
MSSRLVHVLIFLVWFDLLKYLPSATLRPPSHILWFGILKKSSWGPWHLCLRVNLLLQLKQSLCALCFYISFQLNLLGVTVGVERFTRVMVVGTQFNNGGRVNLFVLAICSCLICSKLMVSFNFGLEHSNSIGDLNFQSSHESAKESLLCPIVNSIA